MHDTMPGDPPDRTSNLRHDVRAALDRAWVAQQGYTAPNTTVYPWLWLWDSCFHSLVWAELGERKRAIAELITVDAAMAAEIAGKKSGFAFSLRFCGGPNAPPGLET